MAFIEEIQDVISGNPLNVFDFILIEGEVALFEVLLDEEAVIDYFTKWISINIFSNKTIFSNILTLIFTPSVITLSRIKDLSHEFQVVNGSQVTAKLEANSS